MQIRHIAILLLTLPLIAGFAYANDTPSGFDYGAGFRAIENDSSAKTDAIDVGTSKQPETIDPQ